MKLRLFAKSKDELSNSKDRKNCGAELLTVRSGQLKEGHSPSDKNAKGDPTIQSIEKRFSIGVVPPVQERAMKSAAYFFGGLVGGHAFPGLLKRPGSGWGGLGGSGLGSGRSSGFPPLGTFILSSA